MKKILLTLLFSLLLAPVMAGCTYTYEPSELPWTDQVERTITADIGDNITLSSNSSFLSFPSKLFFNYTDSMNVKINITIPTGTAKDYYQADLFFEKDTGQKTNITFCLNVSLLKDISIDDLTEAQLLDLFQQLIDRMGEGEIVRENTTIYKPVVFSEGVYDWASDCDPKHIQRADESLIECRNTTEYLKDQNQNFTTELEDQRSWCDNRYNVLKSETVPTVYLIPLIFLCFILALLYVFKEVFGGRIQ